MQHMFRTDLASLGIVRATDPPLVRKRQIPLKVVQQIRAGHSAA